MAAFCMSCKTYHSRAMSTQVSQFDFKALYECSVRQPMLQTQNLVSACLPLLLLSFLHIVML
jgi:hypothetical protein